MATYNGERYLPEMLDSLAGPDAAARTSSSSATTAPPTARSRSSTTSPLVPASRSSVLPAGERLGYAQNFVTVSRACTGDLLFFADQDDVWRPDKLRDGRPHGAAGGEPAALFHDFSLQGADGSPLAPSFFGVLAERGFGPSVALKGCTHRGHPGLHRHLGLAAADRRRCPTTSGWRCSPPRSASDGSCPTS